jgi:Ca2+-binding EF-hand superfamily protein
MIGKTTLTVLILATTTTSGFANEPYFPRREKGFSRIDANKDGKVQRSEFAPLVDRRFTKMDTNSDKTITSAELSEAMQQAVERRRIRIMAVLDRDKNGSITEAELDNIVDSMFTGADTDGDGALTLAEMQGFKRNEWRKRMMGQEVK